MENLDVDFIIDGFPCQGILNRDGNLFDLDVKSSFPAISYKPRKITCFHGQQVFVLYNNQIRSGKIFPEFVVENYERPFFNTFEFCLDGLQDFLSVSELHNGKVFSETVVIDGISYLCECINDAEKTIVRVKSICQSVELEKINEVVLRFVQLFALVSYKRVACTSIHIVDDGQKYEFFSWQCKSFSGNKNRHYSLLHAGQIYEKGLWKNILVNFFEKKNNISELGLVCFISFIDSDMFFEDKVIRICGIWNQYVEQVKVVAPNRFLPQAFDNVFEILKKFLKERYPLFNENQKKVADILNEKQDSIKNFLGSHLYERFCVCYNRFEKELCDLFPCALADFQMLVNARNKFAHGKLRTRTQEEFEALYQAFRRIRLLTIVFIYQEFGLPLIFICACIRDSLHGCVRNVGLDRFVLAQIINDIPFFNVDAKTWEYFSQPRVFSCFVYNTSMSLLELDKTTTELAWKEHLQSDEPFYGNYVSKVYPKCKDPVYQNTVFIIYGDSHKEVNGSFLLNYEDFPAELKQKCEKQRSDLLFRRR